MQKISALCVGALAVGATCCALPARAQSVAELVEQVKAMRQQLDAQRLRIEELERETRTVRAAAAPPAPAIRTPPMLAGGTVPHEILDAARGTGAGGQQPAAPAVPAGNPAGAPAPAAAAGTAAVGRAPASDSRTREVAPIFEQPGVLTQRGKYVFEPAIQYGYSSSNRVALVGYTVIPALLIGLIDVREVKRNTTTATATLRTGLSNRIEVEAKLPYVYRSDATVSREVFTGTAVERAFETSGRAIGDVELAARYQLNDGGVDKPYFIGGLRFKSRTGKDPFEVTTDCQRRCIGENVTGSGLPLTLPTGSGFYSLQPSLTWLFPSDPAVFFGSFSYLHNFKREVARTVLGGEKERLGKVAPGAVIGFNFGMGLALNDKASFSVGYDHNSVARTKQDGRTVPGSVRTQLGTLLIGYSYRLSDKKTLSVAVGAGLTRDTPDVSLMVRMPMSF
ncbi:acetate kinase [Massilia jejuensis]|uniref:Acetate kinase n=1 Tax=Massilia jejuensis TaxID=648894 RepID=A0ABW0PF46_9BURK